MEPCGNTLKDFSHIYTHDNTNVFEHGSTHVYIIYRYFPELPANMFSFLTLLCHEEASCSPTSKGRCHHHPPPVLLLPFCVACGIGLIFLNGLRCWNIGWKNIILKWEYVECILLCATSAISALLSRWCVLRGCQQQWGMKSSREVILSFLEESLLENMLCFNNIIIRMNNLNISGWTSWFQSWMNGHVRLVRPSSELIQCTTMLGLAP